MVPIEGHEERPLEFLEDVSFQLTLEMGRAEVSLRKLLNWKPGTVLELNKLADQPFDLRANGRIVARGEVVVVNDQYGVRITSVHAPEDFK